MKSRFAALPAASFLLSWLLIGPVAQAQPLPPAKPTVPYTVEFTWEKQESGATEKGRRRITVDGDMVREEAVAARKDEAVDPRVYIFDRKAGTATEFDPGDANKRYKTGPIGKLDAVGEAVMAVSDGYGSIEKVGGKPIPVGGGQVGGNKCTALAWGAENIGRSTGDRQILCVTDDGIVASVERRSGPVAIKISALKISRDKPDPALLAVPAGFTKGQ